MLIGMKALIFLSLLIFSVLVVCQHSQAALKPSREPSVSDELLASYRAIRSLDQPWDTDTYMPKDLSKDMDSQQVVSKIADKSLQTLIDKSSFKESSIGRTATNLEKSMKQEVTIGQPDSTGKGHKIQFSVQAFESKAQVNYEGLTNASVIYQATQAKTIFAVSEKLSGNRDLVLSHTTDASQQVSQVSIRWNF